MTRLRADITGVEAGQRADPTIYYIPTTFVRRYRDGGGARVDYIREFDIYLMHPDNVGVFTLMMEICGLECAQFPEAEHPDEWEPIPAPTDVPGLPS